MSYTVLQTRKATDQLMEIGLYLAAETERAETALKEVERLRSALRSLQEFPHRGGFPHAPSLKKQGHRVLVAEPYLVFYRCDDAAQTVVITAIVHSRRDYKSLL